MKDLEELAASLRAIPAAKRVGRVASVDSGAVRIEGLANRARVGDAVRIARRGAPELGGEVIALDRRGATAMTYAPLDGLAIGDCATLEPQADPRPSPAWIGRVLDAFGAPLDGGPPPAPGASARLRRAPPNPTRRKPLGARLDTGLAVFDTMLPLVRGQRLGLFAGSGVGKSMLLADLARGVSADVAVLALIGERGRELRHFVDDVLGPEGMARSVVVAATSDQSPLVKRRAAWTAMAAAEAFRDQGRHVLLLVDSLTRFAEAHREVALAAGEPPSLRAYPPSTASLIAQLAERAGTGDEGAGDVTAVFSVLVAGSDMEEPVADITRGVLDGHVVLSREIAERGRFPAVDVRRSVSRSLPGAATAAENALIAEARRAVGAYETAAPMIQTGLYAPGADPELDRAVALHPALDAFFAAAAPGGCGESFARLGEILGAGKGRASGAGEEKVGDPVRAPRPAAEEAERGEAGRAR